MVKKYYNKVLFSRNSLKRKKKKENISALFSVIKLYYNLILK